MKNLKKGLAVLLSVLMVVFSFPFSALALENPNNSDGTYSTDYDVEVGMYVFQYTGPNAWAYEIDYTNLNLIPEEEYTKFSRADLIDNGATNGTFAVAFYAKNVDQVDSAVFSFAMDTSMVNNAYYRNARQILVGDAAASNCVLAGNDYFDDEMLGNSTNSSGNYDLLDMMGGEQVVVSPVGSADLNATLYTQYIAGGATLDNISDFSFGSDTENASVEGSILAVYGMQLVNPDEEINLYDAIVPYLSTSFFQINPDDGDLNKTLYLYDSAWQTDNYGHYGEKVQDTMDFTLFTLPQWGITGPSEEPEEVTYTYNFANDGGSQQVTAPAGTAPQAPANTVSTTPVSNENGTHSYTSYSWPAWQEGTLTYNEVATPHTDDCDMQVTTPQVDPIHSDGQLVDGKTAISTCSVCGYETGGETIDAGEHLYVLDEELSTPATCVSGGTNVSVCSICGDRVEEPTAIDPNAHHVVIDEAVAPTCTDTGLTEGSHCDLCSATIVEQQVVNALGHDFSVQVGESTATCVTPGTTTWKCSRCDETEERTSELNPNNHAGEVELDPETVKEATRGEDGYTGDMVCSACGNVVTEGETIPALGVMITVDQNELGSTTINSIPTTGEAQKVPYTENYTLVATPADDAEFIGWSVNGKLISTDATYTTAAYADLTYVPVFAEKVDDFTVTFVDQFNMVLDTVNGSELASLEAMPETYDYLGYTFADWSMSLEEVKALDANAVVTAYYAKDEALTYTVNAPGCLITVGDNTYNDTAEVGFDEAVTVAPAEGTATAWTVNGNNAAYGAEYTFYVTSDVTVAFTSDEVTAAPTVAAVDVTPTENGQVRFLATRNVPAGYTVLESGFIYGRDFDAPETDLVLENATTGSCYLYKNSNTAGDGQFALTFGIRSQTGVAYARAYVIAADAEGNAAVYYADVQSYDYDA